MPQPDSENSFELIKKEVGTNPAHGVILSKTLANLSPAQLERLKEKASEGKLALELEQLRKVDQFQASSADVDAFIEHVRQLEFAQRNSKWASYKTSGTYTTATGTTTIEAKKNCFVATAVYHDAGHSNVRLLQAFRDEVLSSWKVGRAFISFYYRVGPSLADSFLTKGVFAATIRSLLNSMCNLLRCFRGK